VRVDDHEHPIDELERVFKLYDVTLLAREEPDDCRELDGETADAVADTLAEVNFLAREETGDVGTFGEPEREALEEFRGMNNFENHSLSVIEDALARGWHETDPASDGESRLVDALWHGLSRLDRK
jgi:uncharacterized Ntn-hydrolase superfamily protein